ncbi:hypothetical protein [Sphingobium sp. DN12]|uniref:hypothetical protein n=1 Tax=Sphingobium sp. DN12 TaxID=3378073 RepID=UPI003DA4906A
MNLAEQLWWTENRRRQFILPDNETPKPGTIAIAALDGRTATADADWLASFEVTEAQAHEWAKQEFGAALSDIRQRIDRKIGRTRAALKAARDTPIASDSAVTADALPALLALAKALPGAILGSLSGDPEKLRTAQSNLSHVQKRLNAAGVDVEDKLAAFPDRLAALREDFRRRASKTGEKS